MLFIRIIYSEVRGARDDEQRGARREARVMRRAS